jgi:asparagine synthase (glutamine-hydrolysing)
VADFILRPGVQDPQNDGCIYRDICRIKAGSMLEMNAEGRISTDRWWDWEARLDQPPSLRHEDLAERCRTILTEAVLQRKVGRTSAHFSGGMDSTAVALLAATHGREGADEPIHALSLVYERFPILSQETRYIDSASGGQGLHLHRISGEKHLEFDAIGFDTTPDEPHAALWQETPIHVLTNYAGGLGSQTLMTGLGADELFNLLPYHFHELLRRGRLRELWRESAVWGKAGGNNRWFYLWRHGLAHSPPIALRGGLRCWWRRGRVGWAQESECTIPSWVRPEFAREFQLWSRVHQRLRAKYHRCNPLSVSLLIHHLESTAGDVFRWNIGLPIGLMIAHLLGDPRALLTS